jgi:pimeloyl-ACP methyl ester carboxylesterase
LGQPPTVPSIGMDVREQVVRHAAGRVLLIQEGGDETGQPVLVHAGTPSSRRLYGPHLVDAATRGIRLISYDRPGYGGSTASPGRTIADCAADVLAIIDALGIERIAVWGISGGAPHALACASLLPDRVVAVVSFASPAPFDATGLDWFADQGQDNLDDWKLMLSDPDAARVKLASDREALLAPDPVDEAEMYPTLFSATDVAALTAELADYYTTRTRDSLASGIEGWWEDSHAMLTPWGFDPGEISVPVMLWHGRQDRFVPIQHGEWLAARIPRVYAELTDEDGHLTLMQHRVPSVHAWLLRHF